MTRSLTSTIWRRLKVAWLRVKAKAKLIRLKLHWRR
jgi:hypothetical protein